MAKDIITLEGRLGEDILKIPIRKEVGVKISLLFTKGNYAILIYRILRRDDDSIT